MKPIAMLGIVLAVVGAFILFRGLTYGSQKSVMKVGDVQVSADVQRAVPAWVGGVAIVCGMLLVGAGVGKRRSA